MRFCRGLLGLGYDAFAGVPCSYLTPVYGALESLGARYYAASREDLAVGLAAGFALAGRRPVVLMQNSGLGVSMNALLTLPVMYGLPLLLLVSWRGEHADAPEHIATGARTTGWLDAAGIRHRLAGGPDALDPDFHRAAGVAALIVRAQEFSR